MVNYCLSPCVGPALYISTYSQHWYDNIVKTPHASEMSLREDFQNGREVSSTHLNNSLGDKPYILRESINMNSISENLDLRCRHRVSRVNYLAYVFVVMEFHGKRGIVNNLSSVASEAGRRQGTICMNDGTSLVNTAQEEWSVTRSAKDEKNKYIFMLLLKLRNKYRQNYKH